jgi:hypothetical protein
MTFINDNEVEEVWSIRLEEAKAALIFRECLINGEIHFPALHDFAGLDLKARVAKGGEETVFRLVNEYIAIGKIEDAWAPIFLSAIPAG